MNETKEIFVPENTHIVTTFEMSDDDLYQATKIRFMSGKEATVKVKYPFRSQGNVHIVTTNEINNRYRIYSFDGHKGSMYINENETIEKLEKELNKLSWLNSMDINSNADDVETAICYTLKFKI